MCVFQSEPTEHLLDETRVFSVWQIKARFGRHISRNALLWTGIDPARYRHVAEDREQCSCVLVFTRVGLFIESHAKFFITGADLLDIAGKQRTADVE